MVEHSESRTVLTLRTGTKISFMLAVLLLAAGIYFYFAPILTSTDKGVLFSCGSAASPPTDDFPRSVCRELPDIFALRAYVLAGAALATAALGYVFFGADRRVERRRVEIEDHEDPTA